MLANGESGMVSGTELAWHCHLHAPLLCGWRHMALADSGWWIWMSWHHSSVVGMPETLMQQGHWQVHVTVWNL